MTRAERGRFRKVVEWLDDEFPLLLPVHVWRVAYKRQHGSAATDGKRFWIKVAKRLSLSESLYTLAEEWAHCLEWNDYQDHGNAWSHVYGEIIRRMNGEDEADD